MIIDKSIMTHSITLLSLSVKSKRLLKATFESCRKPISHEIYYTHHEMTNFTIPQRSQFSAQSSQFQLLMSIESNII